MVHHIVLFKLKPEVTPARVEEMMMNTRMQLLKIPEVLSIKCGKRIDPELPWPFFIIDCAPPCLPPHCGIARSPICKKNGLTDFRPAR